MSSRVFQLDPLTSSQAARYSFDAPAVQPLLTAAVNPPDEAEQGLSREQEALGGSRGKGPNAELQQGLVILRSWLCVLLPGRRQLRAPLPLRVRDPAPPPPQRVRARSLSRGFSRTLGRLRQKSPHVHRATKYSNVTCQKEKEHSNPNAARGIHGGGSKSRIFLDGQQASSLVPTLRTPHPAGLSRLLYTPLTMGTSHHLEFESWPSSQTLPLFLFVPSTTHLTPAAFF